MNLGLRVYQGLAFRVGVMLSVALLPVGLIALYQTSNVVRQSEELRYSALLGRTLVAVEPQRDVMHGGFASARVLGSALLPLLDDSEACVDLLRQFVRTTPDYILATFVPKNGISTCNSANRITDLRESPVYKSFQDQPKPRVSALNRGAISGQSVVVIAQPVYVDDTYIGFVSLSAPKVNFYLERLKDDDTQPVDLVTFNAEGQVLLSALGMENVEATLPMGRDLKALANGSSTIFLSEDHGKNARVYSVVAIIPGVVYTFATWDAGKGTKFETRFGHTAILFPVVMWVISLLVAYVAVHRLVIRHVKDLRWKMQQFASGSRGFSPDRTSSAPLELRQVKETFNAMAQTIAQDEADLEDSIREKNVLLKEVHHRVKNNLQLIASIINMEMRKAKAPEARDTLRRVQDRVMGLATVHSNLYHTSSLASVRADKLLNDIIKHTMVSALPSGSGVKVSVEIDKVILVPDQAVPVSLLTTEAATNAVKYIGRPTDGSAPWIKFRLRDMKDNTFVLSVENSKGTRLDDRGIDAISTGLGNQLIKAFATQLSSQVEIEDSADRYSLKLAVKVTDFVPEPVKT